MATFMDVHNGFFGVTGEQLAEAHQRDLDTVSYTHLTLPTNREV